MASVEIYYDMPVTKLLVITAKFIAFQNYLEIYDLPLSGRCYKK